MSGPSVKLPVDWLEGDHLEDLGADVVMLMITGLGYSARQTTDGLVPRRRLRKLWPVDDVEKAIELLVDAGELEDRGDQVHFVRWSDFILDADEVERMKAMNRERTERSRRHQRGDHSMCRPSWCREAARSRDTSRDQSRDGDGTVRVSDGDPYRPDPTRPLGRGGRDRSAGSGSASATPAPAPHDHVIPPGVDEDQPGWLEIPCHVCGRLSQHLIHWIHPYQDNPERSGFCRECLEPVNDIQHTAHNDYLTALEKGLTWEPGAA